MQSCYSKQSLLLLGNDIVHHCGAQQGDSLGPLRFALTFHHIIQCIWTAIPTLALNARYLDDGMLTGSPEDLSAALHIVESEDPSISLHLNCTKYLLFIPSAGDFSLSTLPS